VNLELFDKEGWVCVKIAVVRAGLCDGDCR